MIRNTYHLKLASPAFLGDAEQKGVWRTPPLKALIREWWRVAVAPEVGYDVAKLKRREIALFGTAADEGGGENHKSEIRLALEHWNSGKNTSWPDGEPRTTHPEVKDNAGKPRQVGAELYLGYGPLEHRDGQTRLKKNAAALQAEESNTLKLAFPDEFSSQLQTAFALAHWFGTIGGRSRNGWGSLAWQAQSDISALPMLTAQALMETGSVRPLQRCLDLDWPHAIGSDGKCVLVWQSQQTFPTWREAMKFLAVVKIGFRVALGFNSGDNSPKVEPRHIIAYPVTKHHVGQWGRNVRLANTLRFKLHADADGKLRALIYHTPCKPMLPHPGIDLLGTWQRVHGFLDANAQLTRLA